MSGVKEKGNWGKLIDEVTRRLREPMGQTTFVLYFVFIIFAIGGLGFLIPSVKLAFFVDQVKHEDLMDIPPNIITYTFAIAATAFVDMALSKANIYRPIWVTVLGLAALSVIISIVAYFPSTFGWALFWSIVGGVFALLLWWISNCDKSELKDDFPNPDVMTGGNTDNISGNTTNIQLG